MKKLMVVMLTLILMLLPVCNGTTGGRPARIAFSAHYKDSRGWYVVSMNEDGSNQTKLARFTNIGQHDQWWSHDGRLVYLEGDYREPANWLSITDADGGNRRRILDISGMVITIMSLSPDGNTVLLACRAATPRENPPGPAPENMGSYIDFYSLDVDSGALRRLTDTPDIRKENAVFSPNGRKIAFLGRTDDPATHYDIYVMNADGSNLRRLTHHDSSMMLHDRSLHWSPDSRKVLFSMDNVFISDIRHWGDLFLLDVNSGRVTNLTDSGSDDDVEARWSPDGRKIAFTSGNSTRSGDFTYGICIMDADGSNRVKLDGALSQPCWLPDSKRLLAVRRVAEKVYSLVIIGIDGNNMQTLLTSGDNYSVTYFPVWVSR
jgi:Tol biopolymer transport system component